MTNLVSCIYGTCFGVGYLAVSVFLGVTLVFLFVALISAVADGVDGCIDRTARSNALGAANPG